MVRNSVGISTCKDGHWKIDYAIRHDATGKLLDFFQSQHKDTWYWPLDGVLHNGDLWITLLCVRTSPKTTSAAFVSKYVEPISRNVTGLDRDPQDWKVSYLSLVADGVHANPPHRPSSKATFYTYSPWTRMEKRPEILTRIPLGGLTGPAKNLQYLDRNERWQSGLEPAKARQ